MKMALLVALAVVLLALSASAPGSSALSHPTSDGPVYASIRASLDSSKQPTDSPEKEANALGLSDAQLHALGLDALPTTIWPAAILDTRKHSSTLAAELGPDAEPDDSGFDLEKSRVFARLVSAAYCSNSTVIQAWQCARCQRVPGFQVHSVVYDTAWSLLAYVGYLPELDGIVAVFRGTDNHHWANWIENLRSWQHQRMWPVPNAPSKARVHAGFYNMWSQSQLQKNVTLAIQELLVSHPSASLYVTGHSMGAALGQLCALDAKSKFNITHVHSYTFGSPRVGNAAFQQLFEQQTDSSWRFTHGRDIVPSLPPTLIGYHHVAREVWTLDVQSQDPSEPPQLRMVVCDGSGEDPIGHNSACLMGLCTSVTDHLKYLQYEMFHLEAEC